MRAASDQSGRDRSSSRHSETQAGFKRVGVKQPHYRKTSTSSHISRTDGRQRERIITALNPQKETMKKRQKEKWEGPKWRTDEEKLSGRRGFELRQKRRLRKEQRRKNAEGVANNDGDETPRSRRFPSGFAAHLLCLSDN